jgi:hypothetical protein
LKDTISTSRWFPQLIVTNSSACRIPNSTTELMRSGPSSVPFSHSNNYVLFPSSKILR